MNQVSILNRVVIAAVAGLVIFLALYAAVPIRPLLILMNGLFVGAMVGLAVTYGQLIWNAVLGVRPYDRVQQMALGMAVHWISTALLVGSSIFLVAFDAGQETTFGGLLGRYLAVVAAALKATAPDLGFGIFHGRDRKLLFAGLALGALSAGAVILLQQT